LARRVSGCENPRFSGGRWAKGGAAEMPSGGPRDAFPGMHSVHWAAARQALPRGVRVGSQVGGRCRRSGHGDVQDEGLRGAGTPKPTARNDDRTSVRVAFCETPTHSKRTRPPTRARDPLRALWRDHDPSRGAVGHDNGDFGRRAWRDHAELPDSVAELPFVGRGGLLARRFRRSRSGLDHTANRQEPESGSERTETSCKKLHRHMRERRSDVSKARTSPLSGPAIFSAPSASLLLAPILAEAPQPPQPLACAARASLWICGQRKGVAHIPHRRSKQKQASIYRRRKVSVRTPSLSPRDVSSGAAAERD
jgi:hypothetical protein